MKFSLPKTRQTKTPSIKVKVPKLSKLSSTNFKRSISTRLSKTLQLFNKKASSIRKNLLRSLNRSGVNTVIKTHKLMNSRRFQKLPSKGGNSVQYQYQFRGNPILKRWEGFNESRKRFYDLTRHFDRRIIKTKKGLMMEGTSPSGVKVNWRPFSSGSNYRTIEVKNPVSKEKIKFRYDCNK